MEQFQGSLRTKQQFSTLFSSPNTNLPPVHGEIYRNSWHTTLVHRLQRVEVAELPRRVHTGLPAAEHNC